MRLLISALLLSPYLLAELIHVRDYKTHEPRDRNVLFASAVIADHDVLSWVAKRDGKWRLTRIRGWLDQSPVEQTMNVPAWPATKKKSIADDEFMVSLDAGMFLTPDGKYAVCVAEGGWARNAQRGMRSDNLVSVIDLSRFAVVKTIRTSELSQGNWEVYMSDVGRLVVIDQSFRSTGSGPFKLAIFTIPDLMDQGQCTYTETRKEGAWVTEDENGACATMLTRVMSSPATLRNFLETLRDSYGRHLHPPEDIHQDCASVGETRDRLFRLQSCEKYHLSLWNRVHVTDQLKDNIFSVESGEQIGSIRETTRNTFMRHFAELNGRDYLLILEGGTKLKVYEIRK